MDVSFLPAEWQGPAAVLFGIAMVLFAAWARVFGKKEGPIQPKVQEFAVAGQLADMGPVKALIEQTGLLVQQQVRTNMALEALAESIKEHMNYLRTEREIDEEADRRAERRVDALVRDRERDHR